MKDRTSRSKGKAQADTATLSVRIQPRSSKNEIILMEGGGLKIRLTAPPVDGAANEALIRFLADTFSVSKSQVEIVSGYTSRDKIIRISGIDKTVIDSVLNNATK